MLLKEVIMTALTYLGDEEVALDGELVRHPKLSLLSRCANIVLKEIATDYLPITIEEEVVVKEGRISYDAFSRRVLEVLTIKDANTQIKSVFRHTPSSLEVVNKDIKTRQSKIQLYARRYRFGRTVSRQSACRSKNGGYGSMLGSFV